MANSIAPIVDSRCSSPSSSPETTRSSLRSESPSISNPEDGDNERADKPKLPYIVGYQMTATKHEPPSPFGHGYGYKTAHPPAQAGWETLLQSELCISRPKLGGQRHVAEQEYLTITRIIRTGHDGGAQLVVVNENMVAKIYDPLYYKSCNEYRDKNNVIWDADGDYSREVAAYLELMKSPLAAEVTAAYLGSFVMDVETKVYSSSGTLKIHREVPLILMELLRGTTMLDMKPKRLSPDQRTAILKEALYAESIIAHSGITHGDFCPRNVVVLESDSEHPTDRSPSGVAHPKVKIIDFNVSEVFSHSLHECPQHLKEQVEAGRTMRSQLPSPLVRHASLYHDFYAWMSSGRDEEVMKWLWEQFRDDVRFLPVVWDPLNPEEQPRYVDLERRMM